jgi:hypothetical protein
MQMNATERPRLRETMHKLVMVSPNVMNLARLAFLQQLAYAIDMIGLCLCIHAKSLLESPNIKNISNKVYIGGFILFEEVLEF